MSEIVLRCPGAEPIRDLVTEALKAEEKELLTAILKTKEHLLKFEKRYNLSTSEFISGDPDSFNIDNMEAIEWTGEHETLKRIEDRLSILKEIEVCT